MERQKQRRLGCEVEEKDVDLAEVGQDVFERWIERGRVRGVLEGVKRVLLGGWGERSIEPGP